MKTKTKTLTFSLVLVVIFSLSILNTQVYNTRQENNMSGVSTKDENSLKNPQMSKSWWDNFTFIHLTEANWSIAASYEWCRGDGSWGNPFIIENITMDASSSPTGSGIYIQDSKNVYFVIRNCTVYNAPNIAEQAGIKLENVNNGTLIDNICSDNDLYGILLLGDSGICENNTIVGNTANNNRNGIVLIDYADYNNITGNTANGNSYGGIILDNSWDNNLTDNTANNNKHVGIYLTDSDHNFINNSKCISNAAGIMLYGSDENNITYNSINYNTVDGIDISYSDYNSIINNTLIGNTRAIYEYGDCEGNVYKGNTIIPPSGGGDDDDDDDDDKEATIPGYDVFLLIGLISIMTTLLLIHFEKKKIK